ncbi:MAG TPA: hypothetical protein VF528_14155 [Pyrinomonadaceae bacterium]
MNRTNRIAMQDDATARLWQPCAGLVVAAGWPSSLQLLGLNGGGQLQRRTESLAVLSVKSGRHLKI